MLSIAEIHDLRRAAEAHWRRLHEEMEADYHEVDLGPEVSLTIDGEPQHAINPHTAWVKVSSACNHLIDADLEIRVDSAARGKAARERGEQISATLRTLHYHLTADAKADPHRGGLFDAATMGMGVWYVGVDFSRLLALDARKPPRSEDESDQEYDERDDVVAWKEERRRALPLVFDHEDPRRIFPDPATHGDLYVMKVERRLAGDIRRHWVGWDAQLNADGRRKSDFDEVEWFELWSAPGGLSPDDPGSYYYEADQVPIKRFGTDRETGEEVEVGTGPWPHGLGICPFVVWNAGYGMPRGEPQSVYKGLVRNARQGGLFRAKAEKRTQLHAITRAASFHAWAVPEGYAEAFQIGGGAINEMPRDENGRLVVPVPIVGPAPPTVLLTEAAALQSDINSETVSDVLSAPGESGAEVALLYARMVQEAAMALGPLRRNAERAYDRIWERLARILANPDLFDDADDFQVLGVDKKGNPTAAILNRKLFAGNHVFRTTIDPRFATDQIGRTQSGLAQVAAGVIDPETHHREYSGLDNPQQIVARARAARTIDALVAKGFFEQFAMAFASGQLQKDVKGRDWLKARMEAEQQTASELGGQQAAAGPELVPSTRQGLGPPGAAALRPGGGFAEVGASDALSGQLPSRGQGPGVV